MTHLRGSIVVVLLALGCNLPEPVRTVSPEATIGPADSTSMRKRREELYVGAVYRDQLWTRLEDPQPGEWLAFRPEHGQTFEEYQGNNPIRLSAGRSKLVLKPLVPLGRRAQRTLEPLRSYCAAWFGAETVLAEPGTLPDAAYRSDRKQYDADALLDVLAPLRPADALVLAGVCDLDLFGLGLNFLFGMGDWDRSVGVYSLVRFDEQDTPEPLYLERSFALLTHEIGHAFGLRHCIYYRCVMNGANSLDESDGAPLEPCPVCLRKLQHALGFDVRTRWGNLAPMLERLGIAKEAARVRALMADLGQEPVPWRLPNKISNER